MIEVPVDKRPDHMGVWSDDGDPVWLPREHYPTRTEARYFAMRELDAMFMEVKVLSRWMRYDPHIAGTREEPLWWDDLWVECDRSEPNAFPVWRVESYTLPWRSSG